MLDPNSALASSDIAILVWTAAALGLIHTVLGPDHYLPFVMMSRAQNWTRNKLATVVILCGIGHVAGTIVIATALIAAGTAASQWASSKWSALHEFRGDLTAWVLMGVGAGFLLWGLQRGLRGHTHSHRHRHEDGQEHEHEHSHTHAHAHVHDSGARRLTPWVLFLIFVFGPCESLVPLMLAAWSLSGLGGTVAVAGVFGCTTILAMMGMVAILVMGVSRINMGHADRWSMALAGFSLVLCGAGIQWLGL